MIEGINSLLTQADVQVRISTEWYRLEEISISDDGTMPIVVTDCDGGEWDYDMADIDEFDSAFEAFKGMDTSSIIGEA
jgi:hypothetical protein